MPRSRRGTKCLVASASEQDAVLPGTTAQFSPRLVTGRCATAGADTPGSSGSSSDQQSGLVQTGHSGTVLTDSWYPQLPLARATSMGSNPQAPAAPLTALLL